jgi:pimeloyl-ACP methyl ester carboxylesterase
MGKAGHSEKRRLLNYLCAQWLGCVVFTVQPLIARSRQSPSGEIRMSTKHLAVLAASFILLSPASLHGQHASSAANATHAPRPMSSGYAPVNGLRMYYELHGTGRPLVLIHGGGSTITTTFGTILPTLAKTHRVIAVELQAHGHTSDRNAPSRFEQDADDVAELMRQLQVDQADVLGFSNGGNTAMQLAMRHPGRVRRLILASTFYKRTGMDASFWTGMDNSRFSDMPQLYKDEFLKITHDSAALLTMYDRDATRMRTFQDWRDEDIRSIQAPALVVIGDHDVIRPEHAVAMYRLLPRGRLAVLTGTHGSYMGEALSPDRNSKVPALFAAMVDEFLAGPATDTR